MAELSLDHDDFQHLARLITRELGPPRVEMPREPRFITEAELAQRWPWIGRRALRDARLGSGKIEINGPSCTVKVRLPDKVSRPGGAIAYWCRRQAGRRTVEDVEDELPVR